MKTFLLTWYGITDLRASLGFENTNGPIVGALAAEQYSEVVILGYTRSDNDSKESIEAQKHYAKELAEIRSAGQDKDLKATGAFITKFANTTAAHEHFVAWLKEKATSMGMGVHISFKSEKIRELNDTEGIYACAMQALDLVEREPGEKHVTLYISPGTPVMAFVWALAALGHPALKKRLLASSVIGKPPEVVALPAEWLELHATKREKAIDAASGFDVIFHLFGEQRMPSLLGIRQFESKQHIFVNSKEYPAACMRQFIPHGEFAELAVDPWDVRGVHEKIVQRAKVFPSNAHIAINLTGGTKLMFAGALSAARVLGAVPVYFDSRNRSVTFVDSFQRESIKPIDSVETFLCLNSDGLELSENTVVETGIFSHALQQIGLKPSNNAVIEIVSPKRQTLTKALWEYRNKLSKLYQELKDYNDSFRPFRLEQLGLVFTLNEDESATIQGHELDLDLGRWPDFAKYLSGGWFEEYVYLQCKPYEDSGIIQDLRINVKLSMKQKDSGGNPKWKIEYNELDVVFTDGYSLYIIECKAGKVTQEQIMKLQNIVRFYGGIEGRGIIACCIPPNMDSVNKKIKDAKLTLWSGEAFSEHIKALMNSIAARAKATGGEA